MNPFKFSFAKERLILIHQHMIVITVGNLVAIAMIYLSVDGSQHAYLRKWVVLISSITIIRAVVWIYYHYHPYAEANANRRLSVLFVFMFIAGALWGTGGIAIFNLSSANDSILLMLIFGAVVSGTLVSLSSVLPLFIMYATLVITPLGLYLILLDDQELIILGSSLFIFLLANILMSFNVERSIVDMIVLRDNNEKLITELRAQKNIAEQSNIGKSKFLAAISHDLRQPMHAMGLFLNGLEPYVRKPGQEVFNKVQNSAIALRSLFNGLLDISRLDSGVVEPTLEVINLAPFLQKIIDGFHGEAQEKGLTLKSELLQLGVRSDPMLLERVIRNLLANAIQYTDSGQVKLVAFRQDDRVTITIEDEGRGIPKDELNNIFSEYHQLHNAERDRSKGVGLGLAIVRRICTLLSIPIEVRSYLGQGSTFKISLPVADITTLKTTDISRSPWNLHGYLIVVVDDEQDIRDATERLLKEWGCDTIVVGSGSEAIEQLSGETEMPKLLIVDYRLREETGIDVIVRIRSLYTREVSAMIVTGDTMVDLKKVAGENDLVVLHKPVSPAELRTAIHLLISQQNKNE